MTHWNHRVIRHVDIHFNGEVEDIWFGVHEVFYLSDDNLEGASWTMDAIKIVGESPDSLLWAAERLKACLDKPILMIEGNSLKEWKP